MNILEQCVIAFEELLSLQYHFQISKKKRLENLIVEFEKSDFKHLIGLQYLKDIAMSKNSEKVFDAIMAGKITYEKIRNSVFYEQVTNSYANVKSRMEQFPKLKNFLETDNWILKYIKNRNPYSKINADYVMESTIGEVTVYIFLRKKENGRYCVCSFFVKDKIEYKGEVAYWLLKERMDMRTGEVEIIYRRENMEED